MLTRMQKRFVKFTLFVATLFLLVWCMRYRNEVCGAEERLRIMLTDTVKVFQDHKITYWLDFGTLLGAMREKGIIGWEYDVDLGMPEDMCDKAATPEVRAAFQALGYTLYDRSDYIPQKVKPTYDHQKGAFGYSSGYMSTVCLRVYDKNLVYFVDVYWYRLVKQQDAKAAPKGELRLPEGYQFQEDLLCNNEGLDKSEFFPGGCREYSKVLPVSSVALFGTQLAVPAKPEENLGYCYGKNWRVPNAKGMNGLICQGSNPFRSFTE